MKKTTKKLLMSIMILLAAVSIATASTYAWFTMNDTPEAESFDLNVTSVDGLYISLTGENGTFKQYISANDITNKLKETYSYTVGENQMLQMLTHATYDSTAGEYGVPENNTITQKRTDGTETTSYEFTIHFRSASAYSVTLKTDMDGSSVISVPPEENAPAPIEAWANGLSFPKDGAPATFNQGAAIAARAQDAIRLAFVNDADTPQRFVWDPNPTKGFTDNTYMGNVAARHHNFKHGSKFGDVLGAAVPEVDGGGTVGTVIPTLVNDINNPDPVTEEIIPTVLLELVYDSTAKLYNGSLTITLWLEGWDANALNSVLADIITTKLVFQGVI